MTSATMPNVLRLPTPRDIWESVKMHESVAKVALICATVLGVVVVGGIVAVAVLGGDVSALSLALGGIVTAAITAWSRRKNGGNGNGTS